ncbi:MAG: MerR family transcriptional regulator [Gammaproteobacteria bacterium]|nr:MerR family transcriptional regulator [Gammaproteobacteria bacterium]
MQARKRPEDTNELPAIPDKRYFTIGEASELCAVKPHVLRYWEQEFPKLNPVKRRGNRRYYQREDIELIRRIRTLLYDQGFTINGARQQLDSADNEGHTPVNSLRDIILRVESVLALLRERSQHKD